MNDPDDNANLSVYSFGAITVGNTDFVTYSNSQIGNQIKRVWNTMEPAPRKFTEDEVKDLHNLYADDGIRNADKIEAHNRDVVIPKITGKDYAQVGGSKEYQGTFRGNFPPVLNTDSKKYRLESVRQHTKEYIDLGGISQIRNVSNLPPRLFSDNVEGLLPKRFSVQTLGRRDFWPSH